MDLSLYLQIESQVIPHLKDFEKAVHLAITQFPQGKFKYLFLVD